MSASPALSALRRATVADHAALEHEAEIESRLADPSTRAATVAAFHRFHAAVEATAHPVVAALDGPFRPRSRAEGIARDLIALGMTPQTVSSSLRTISTGAALGWVYVAEGSMLGGRIIRKRLTAAGADLHGLTFLDPYGDQTGERWRAFLALLDQACADGAATVDDIVRGGVEAFAFARQILTPQPEEAAA